jgi:DNA-binding GntR family transcriptional regulator
MMESLRQKIYKSIRDDITYGKLFPGERLVESQLAEKFNASRSPIREAIRQLEGDGLIRVNQKKGITVSRLSIKEIVEIYKLRWLLEGYAARLSAEQVTKAQILYLRNLHEKLKVAGETSDVPTWIHNNILFHDFFSENCGNGNLHQILVNLKRRVYLYHYMIVSTPGNFKFYIDHHEEILKACKKNDGEMAEKYMKLHVESIKQVLLDQLDKFRVFYGEAGDGWEETGPQGQGSSASIGR